MLASACDLDADGRVASSPPAHVAAPTLTAEADPESSVRAPTPDDAAPTATMFERGAAKVAVDRIAKRVGGKVRAIDLSIFPNRVRLQAQSAQDRTKVEGWEVRVDQVFGPVPVRLSGAGHLERNLFSVSAVNLDQLPRVVRDAKDRLSDIQGGEVSYVSIDRDLPFSRQVMFRVFVEGDADRGYADFDAKGRYVRSAKGTPR